MNHTTWLHVIARASGVTLDEAVIVAQRLGVAVKTFPATGVQHVPAHELPRLLDALAKN